MGHFSLQDYPALRVSLVLAAGIFFCRLLDLSESTTYFSTLLLFGTFLLLFFLSGKSNRMRPVDNLVLLFLIASAGSSKFSFDSRSTTLLPDSLLGRNLVLRGSVIDPPVFMKDQVRILLRADQLIHNLETVHLDCHILVSIKKTKKDTADLAAGYGKVLAVHGSLSRPPQERNPGEFSARTYYGTNGILYLMVVRGFGQARILDEPGGWWLIREIVVPSRTFISDLISQTIGGEEGEFLKGILIGDRSGISPGTRQAFTNSGVAHVLAVSGAHAAIVGAILFFLFEFLRLPRWAHSIATAAGLVFYMLLTGSNPPVVRATIMALVFLLARMIEEKPNALNAIGVAALIILAIDSRQLFDVGFQLSFSAVLSLIYFYPKAERAISHIQASSLGAHTLRWILRAGAVTCIATAGTLPLTAVYFGRISLIGVVANLLVMPAVGLGLALGFVSAIASVFSQWIAETYAHVNTLLLRAILSITDYAGGLPFAYVDTLRFRPVDSLPYYAGLLYVTHLTQRPIAPRLCMLFLVLLNVVTFLPPSPVFTTSPGKLRVSFIDVGQGDAALVEFPDGKTMLVDAGIRTPEYDSGERTVGPFLKRKGISRIDILVVSHAHADHIGGTPHILRKFDVGNVVYSGQHVRSETFQAFANESSGRRSYVRAGEVLDSIPFVRVYFLYPHHLAINPDTTRPHPNLNNTSVVFKLCYGNHSFFFSGDAEKEAEGEMVHLYGDFLQSTLLKIGHHGSNTSTTQQFLHAVQPAHAVISVGFNNKFRHPSHDVLARLSETGISVSRTDEEGAIVFETDGFTLTRIDWR